jgi:hypothetical protein
MLRRAHLFLLFSAVVATSAPALADQRHFTYTYDWFTPSQGEKELEAYWTQHNGGVLEPEIEFEYGVTPRWTVAPYLVLGREHGEDIEVKGWRLEQRYRLGNYARNRILPALYFEVSKENSEPFELEGKFITSYLFGNGYIWSTNLIFAGLVGGGQGTEVSYATGVSHPLGRRWNVGAELFGTWTPERQHFFGPTVGYQFAPGTQLLATVGMRYAGAEGGAVRLIFEKEWR